MGRFERAAEIRPLVEFDHLVPLQVRTTSGRMNASNVRSPRAPRAARSRSPGASTTRSGRPTTTRRAPSTRSSRRTSTFSAVPRTPAKPPSLASTGAPTFGSGRPSRRREVTVRSSRRDRARARIRAPGPPRRARRVGPAAPPGADAPVQLRAAATAANGAHRLRPRRRSSATPAVSPSPPTDAGAGASSAPRRLHGP